MNLSAKTVFVTGSSRGIGKAIAVKYAKEGCNIILNASKSQQELTETEKEIKSYGVCCISFLGDVSDYSVCKSIFQQAKSNFGTIDVLINNAGVSCVSLFTDMQPGQWESLLRINLNSVINCTHLALPDMVSKKKGCIINISSMWGERGASCEAVYSASKGGVNSFTKAIAKEVGPSGIRVNAIACGVIDTKMNDWLTIEEKQALQYDISLMRFGKAEEIGDLAVFLSSQKAAFLTGQIITLDGGMV